VNVVVVGAGVVGYAIAYELAARGARVQIIDPRGSGLGATRASAGILAPYIEGHSNPLLALGVSSLALYDRFIARLTSDAATKVEYRRSGTLQAALTEHQAAELATDARRLAASRASYSLLSTVEARQLEPSLSEGLTSALLIPDHGYVGVPSLMAAVVDAGAHLGVMPHRDEVASIASTSHLQVRMASGMVIEGDAVIVAAGSWSSRIAPLSTTSMPVRPIRGQLVQLRAPAHLLTRVIWGADCYIVPWTDGTVLVGATMEDVGFDERTTDAAVKRLRASASALVPALEAMELVEARAGLRPATPDELPIIGPSSRMRGVFYATGHFRNGVLLAPLTASLVADLVLEGRAGDELALVRPDRFGL
jgi:glycine oxidase